MEKRVYQIPEKQWRHGYTQDMEGLGNLYEKSLVTRQSLIPGENEDIKRPLSLRYERAKDFKAIMAIREKLKEEQNNGNLEGVLTSRSEIGIIINRAKKRDKICVVSLKPNPISIDMGNIGVQTTNYVDIVTEFTDSSKTPLFIFMGVGNGIDGLGPLGQRIAMQTNQEVFMIAQPDSWQGNVTKPFLKAVKKSKNFEPHLEFFKLVTKKILEERNIDKFDICGVSAGAIMASGIIKDKEFSRKIGKKNLITPPGITPFYENLFKRLIMQYKTIKDQRKRNNLPNTIVANIELIGKEKMQRKLYKKTFHTMAWKLAQKYSWWEGLEGANVIIADKDAVTYGIKHINEVVASNPKLRICVINGGHEIVGAEPEKVIEKMDI